MTSFHEQSLRRSRAALVGFILGGIVLAALALYLQKAYRFLVVPKQDPYAKSEIKIYGLSDNPGRRTIAEWEPAGGVLVAYPFQLPYTLLQEIAHDNSLYVLVKGASGRGDCLEEWDNHGTDTENVSFIQVRQGDGYFYTRDFGPYTVEENGQRILVGFFHDYPFSGYDSEAAKIGWLSDAFPLFDARHENEVPAAVARHFHVKYEQATIALTGGAALFDGKGTLFINQLVIDENRAINIDFEEFKGQLIARFGVRRLIVLPNYESWGIQHIDCLLKLLDEKRILVKELDGDHPDYERVERIASGLSAIESPDGSPYQVLRIRTPDYAEGEAAPYTNSLILGAKILVPLMGIPGDAEAIATWQAAAPGYEVTGYELGDPARDRRATSDYYFRLYFRLGRRLVVPWTYTDALHCRTKSLFLR
jgi:agmatine deiminase